MVSSKAIFAGFGGQGIMKMGVLLAYAGMLENKSVSWLPSYGPEMRGGTANCHVMISDRLIDSPLVHRDATALVVMNQPSLAKFLPELTPGGALFLNSSLIRERPDRQDIEVVNLPVNQITDSLGSGRVANLVMLGAFLQKLQVVEKASLEAALCKSFQHKADLLALNLAALARGMALIS